MKAYECTKDKLYCKYFARILPGFYAIMLSFLKFSEHNSMHVETPETPCEVTHPWR